MTHGVHLHQLVVVRSTSGKFAPFKPYAGGYRGPDITDADYPWGVVVRVADDGTVAVQSPDFELDEPVEVTPANLASGVVEPVYAADGTPVWGH